MSTRTRSGRLVKKPERYEPCERVEDDFSDDESGDDDDLSDYEEDSSTDNDDESDADENGNLKDFIVPDSDEETENSTQEEHA
jgi:hypothetical protein